MPKLSKRTIDALEPRETDFFVFDERLPGFGVRVLASGVKTFQVQYKSGGRTRRKSLGRHGALTADEARREAQKILGEVAKGDDPIERIAEARRAPTMAGLAERFLEEHVGVRCKPRTAFDYKSALRRLILPRLGAFRIVDVTRKDVAALHDALRATPIQANRVLTILSKMFNLAELWGLRPDGSNPCRHIQKYRETRRERYLKAGELARLGGVLAEVEAEGSETAFVVAAYRLLLLTGCRLREIERLEWAHVTETHLELPDSKTGRRRVPLPPEARAILEALRRRSSGAFVIEGKIPGAHITDLEKPWQRVRRRAGLDDVRLHDLRHSYASMAVQNGVDLLTVGAILGHKSLATTRRYAHLSDAPIRDAADKVSSLLSQSLAAGPANTDA